MSRSLYFALDAEGRLCPAATMVQAVIEIVGAPEGYSDMDTLEIVKCVHDAKVLETRARRGASGGPVRVTWSALVEKGIAAGVLAEEEA